jgi:hypothetical protein
MANTPPPSGPRTHHGTTPPPAPRPDQAQGVPLAGITPQLAAQMGLAPGSGNPMSGQSTGSALDFNIPADVVLLPSEGLWYPHGKATLLQQHMTASEENILMDAARILARTQWNDLLTALIRDPDFLPPGKLLPADFTRCLLQARINGYGDEYEVQVLDPFTGKALLAPYNKIRLSAIRNRPLLHRPDADGLFTFMLPVLKKSIRFRLLTNDEYMIQLLDREKKDARGESAVITDRLYAQMVEVDGSKERNYLHRLAMAMPSLDSSKLRLFMDEVEPALDTTMDFVSSTTGNPTFQSKVSLNDSIFYF